MRLLIAVLLIAQLGLAQKFPSYLPPCGRRCFNAVEVNLVTMYGCGKDQFSCYCSNPNFIFGYVDCTNQYCKKESRAQVADSYVSSFCNSVLSTITATATANGGGGIGGVGPKSTIVTRSTEIISSSTTNTKVVSTTKSTTDTESSTSSTTNTKSITTSTTDTKSTTSSTTNTKSITSSTTDTKVVTSTKITTNTRHTATTNTRSGLGAVITGSGRGSGSGSGGAGGGGNGAVVVSGNPPLSIVIFGAATLLLVWAL